MGLKEKHVEGVNAKFIFLHSTTPEIADRTRNLVLQNQVIINQLLEQGAVTVEQLEEMSEDKKLQNEYRELLVSAQDGGCHQVYASLKIKEYALFNPERFAGWLQFSRRHHEWKWGLKLLSPEEEDITELPTPLSYL